MFSICAKIIFFITLIFSPQLFAESERLVVLQDAVKQSNSQFETLQKGSIDTKQLDSFEIHLVSQKNDIDQCIDSASAQFVTTQKSVESLGEKYASDESDIKVARIELEKQLATVDTELKSCSLLKIKVEQLLDSTIQLRSEIKKEQLLSKEFSIQSGITKLSSLDGELVEYEFNSVQPLIERLYTSLQWKPVLAILSGFIIGFFLQRYERRIAETAQPTFSQTFSNSKHGLLRTAPLLLALLFFWGFLFLQGDITPLVFDALFYVGLLFFTYGLLRGVLFPKRKRVVLNARIVHSVRLLAWLFLFFALTTFILNYEETGRYANSVILYLAWLTSMIIAALSFIMLLWLITRHLITNQKTFYGVYLIPVLTLLIAIVFGLAGYRNISSLLFFGTINSLIIIIISVFLLRVVGEFFDSLDEGRLTWQSKLRNGMRLEAEQAFPGVLWLRILSFFGMMFVAIMGLMFVWGSSHQRISSLVIGLKDGIKVGGLNLDLLNLVYAFLVFVVVLSVLPFIKNQLLTSWLKHSNLSNGAKDATKTLVGYAGVAIAILWALYIAGVNFQNLAILAGALSVGIGFGLQNIVNNFVSGLILLFERPVRRGDWIMVGTTEGIVKDISIRSTTIQTFNKSDVIVPNSELISNQVTNWMLTSNIGRLQVPVGVAYGSDVSQVLKILELIAESHHDIIIGNSEYQIQALFLGFGDSALNFELRCFVKNVNNRLSILSTINQQIDKEFRKAGIEIPFPQRVVHMAKDDK